MKGGLLALSTDLRRISYWPCEGRGLLLKKFLKRDIDLYGEVRLVVGKWELRSELVKVVTMEGGWMDESEGAGMISPLRCTCGVGGESLATGRKESVGGFGVEIAEGGKVDFRLEFSLQFFSAEVAGFGSGQLFDQNLSSLRVDFEVFDYLGGNTGFSFWPAFEMDNLSPKTWAVRFVGLGHVYDGGADASLETLHFWVGHDSILRRWPVF